MLLENAYMKGTFQKKGHLFSKILPWTSSLHYLKNKCLFFEKCTHYIEYSMLPRDITQRLYLHASVSSVSRKSRDLMVIEKL